MRDTYVVDEEKSCGTGEEKPASPVAPGQTGNSHREEETHADDQGKVPTMLPLDDFVSAQIGHVGDTRLSPWLDDHPADVRPQQALVGRVRVEVGVGVSVMGAMSASPPADGTFDGTGSAQCEEILERLGRVVGTMRPKSVVSCGQTSSEPCGSIGARKHGKNRSPAVIPNPVK